LWVAKGSNSILVSASVDNDSLRKPPLLISQPLKLKTMKAIVLITFLLALFACTEITDVPDNDKNMFTTDSALTDGNLVIQIVVDTATIDTIDVYITV
jgi:hypothetical protein